MNRTATDRELLDAIEPYVFLAASTLVTSAYQRSHAAFALLSRPKVYSATAIQGHVDFEVPDWLPIEEALLGSAEGGLHSVVKHLALPRASALAGRARAFCASRWVCSCAARANRCR
ncbi:MAG: hypothetical protein HC937_01805 [Aquincola sp.]|nr:hypothetical protein [Aquincola sp.]